jgi:6-phosphogluconolactonase (cycloisomerase 2 family)
VSTPASVVGIAFAPSGKTAYVLSDCVGTSCDGSVAPYAIANTGVLGPAGAATLTGSHVNPVDLFVDGSGAAAYLLANFMGVDTNSGSIYLYTISGAGELTPSKPSSISLTGAAVAQSAFGPDLYVLTGPSSVIGGGVSHVATYSIGNQGELTSVSGTQISASEPTGMALVGAH